ncbi:unnamed protein product, partial [Ranitomeya imitator]
AIEHYKKLLKILNTIKISEKGEMDPQFKRLLYETHYHLGIALQNVNGHEEAVRQYTKALQASSIRKKSCAVGCTVGTCLHTPVLTRRAFAFMKCGETRNSLRDAHAAVVSDRLNPVTLALGIKVTSHGGTLRKSVDAVDCAMMLDVSSALYEKVSDVMTQGSVLYVRVVTV